MARTRTQRTDAREAQRAARIVKRATIARAREREAREYLREARVSAGARS